MLLSIVRHGAYVHFCIETVVKNIVIYQQAKQEYP
jgi:hypothetical protein